LVDARKKIPSWSNGLRGGLVVVKRLADTLERGIRSTVSIEGEPVATL